MGVKWTPQQQQVIELRNRNILVSAAAGSGKTAVLVERIISMIMDEKNPVDIDHLLIVTFTNAAAGEMRERIRDAIEKKLEEGENEHLERQLTLVHHAQITTIHSFCQYVIRNYFHLIDLDPAFRIGDEGEIRLLKNDVMEDLIEERYASKEEKYHNFVECYAQGKSDRELGSLILQIYEFSMSYPWPEKWLMDCREAYAVQDEKDLVQARWMPCLLSHVRLLIEDNLEKTRQAIDVTVMPDGPYMYEEALRSDEKMLTILLEAESYPEYSERFSHLGKFAALSRKKDEAVSEEKRELVKEIRDQVKKSIKGIQEQYFYASVQRIASDLAKTRGQAEELLDLASEFSRQYAAKKREKNLLDFNDLEHMALDILVEEKEGRPVPTEAARQFSAQFEEVMIDEYQDSNLVQEYILTSVSRQYEGRNNVFMVGDVKQSIYRFRLARPELFMEKYATYSDQDGPRQKIELHRNFRSRSQVLEPVNFLFRRIMRNELGNVEYDDAAALYPGAAFPEGKPKEELQAEILLLDLEAEEEAVEESGETAVELEARMAGKRIRALVGREQVLDKQTGQYRPARYKDVVVLLRTVSGWADTFSRILGEMGIPAYTGSRTGYFSALEVQTVLALLKIVDNPIQDIPMAAVLRSPIVGITDEELAMIRSSVPGTGFAQACFSYPQCAAEGEKADCLRRKLEVFFAMLSEFRCQVPYTAMHELLWKIYDRTGYRNYASAMPGGDQRAANLDMLVEKAMAYESTSYRGLFNFIRYINQLQKYDVDFGEASTLGEEEDTVRIMSIHKSKGLEFPVVIAAGMGKRFNQQDSRSRLALHPDLGLGCDCIDPELRLKTPTLLKKLIQKQTAYENLGEELRVLYVALTRAKEKLILTGSVAKRESRMKRWEQAGMGQEDRLSFGSLAVAGSYLDWIIPPLLRAGQDEAGSAGGFRLEIWNIGDLAVEEAAHQLTRMWTKEQLLEWDVDKVYDKGERESLQGRMRFSYPYQAGIGIYGKMTVSELKSLRQTADAGEEYALYPEPELVPLIPDFIEQREATGAALGTIYHKFLECLDFAGGSTEKALSAQVEALCLKGKLTGEEAGQIQLPKIAGLLESELGRRIKRAQVEGALFRERQFVLGLPAREVRHEWDTDDTVLVQGIIDAYFYEEGEIVLVDYKTDYVPRKGERILVQKYEEQLKYYARALEQMTGMRVKEQYIYSFWLQKELRNM